MSCVPALQQRRSSHFAYIVVEPIMKSPIWIAIILVSGAAFAYLGYNYGINSAAARTETADETNSVEPASVRGQGKLQPAGGTISIVAQPGERVDQILVNVGDDVKKNAPLIALASRKIRRLEWDLANARKSETLAQADLQTKANEFKFQSAETATAEAESAKAKVNNQSLAIAPLRTSLVAAKRSLEKLKRMQANPVTGDLVGQNEIDQQQSLVDTLSAQIDQAVREVALGEESAERAHTLAVSQRDLAKYNLDNASKLVPTGSLDTAIKMAKMAYDATLLKSPVDGKVLDIATSQGDSVATRPLMLIGDTKKMICVAEITDAQLGQVEKGAAVEMTSGAFEQTLHGTVIEIGTMIGPPSMADPNPFAAVDRKTGKVKIELTAEAAKIAADFVNLQVEVKVLVTSSSQTKSNDSAKNSKNTNTQTPVGQSN